MFYNNLLSLPFILLMMAVTGEVHSVWQEPDLFNPTFLLVAGFSGLIGFGIRCNPGAGPVWWNGQGGGRAGGRLWRG